MNRDVTTTGCYAKSAASTADPNAPTNALIEIAHDSKYAGNGKDRFHTMLGRAVFPVIAKSREELKSLIELRVKSAVDTAQREEMRSMLRKMVGETIFHVIASRSCAATGGIKSSSFSFLEKKSQK